MTTTRMAQVFGATAILCGCVFAQTTTGTLQGTVVDPADATVPGATIELKNAASGAVRMTTSTARGMGNAFELRRGDRKQALNALA